MTRPDDLIALERLVDVLLERDDLAAPIATVRGDEHGCSAVGEAVFDAFAAEAAEDDAVHRADARASEHGDGRFGNVRHVNEHAIALLASIALEDIRENADFAVKLLIGEHATVARFAFPDDGRLIAARAGKMTVQAVFGHIEFAAKKPFGKRHSPIENLCPLLPPQQIGGLLRPKFFG